MDVEDKETTKGTTEVNTATKEMEVEMGSVASMRHHRAVRCAGEEGVEGWRKGRLDEKLAARNGVSRQTMCGCPGKLN